MLVGIMAVSVRGLFLAVIFGLVLLFHTGASTRPKAPNRSNDTSGRNADLLLHLWRQRLQRSETTASPSLTLNSASGQSTKETIPGNHFADMTVLPSPDAYVQSTTSSKEHQKDSKPDVRVLNAKMTNKPQDTQESEDNNSTDVTVKLKSNHSEVNESFVQDYGGSLLYSVTSDFTQKDSSWHRASNVSLHRDETFGNHSEGNGTGSFLESSEFSASEESVSSNISANLTDNDNGTTHSEQSSNTTCVDTSLETSDFSDTVILSGSSPNVTTQNENSALGQNFTKEESLEDTGPQNMTSYLDEGLAPENDSLAESNDPTSTMTTSDTLASGKHVTHQRNPLLTICQPSTEQQPPMSQSHSASISNKRTTIIPKEDMSNSQPIFFNTDKSTPYISTTATQLTSQEARSAVATTTHKQTTSQEAVSDGTTTAPEQTTSQEAILDGTTTAAEQTTSGYMKQTTVFDPLTNRGGPFLRKPNAFDFLMMGQIATAQRNEKQREFRESNYEASAQICGLLNKKFCRLSIGGRCC